MSGLLKQIGDYATPVTAAAGVAYEWWQGGPIPKEPIEELATSVVNKYKETMPIVSHQLAALGAARPFISVAATLDATTPFAPFAAKARKVNESANRLILDMGAAIRKADSMTTGQSFAEADTAGESVESGLARVALIRGYIAKIQNNLTVVNSQLYAYIGKFEKELKNRTGPDEGDESKETEESSVAHALSAKLLEIPENVQQALLMFKKSIKTE